MNIKLLKILASLSIVLACVNGALAEDKSPVKSASVDAIEKAHQAASSVEATKDELSKEAESITDDESAADEDMEMPEEDLEDVPADSQEE